MTKRLGADKLPGASIPVVTVEGTSCAKDAGSSRQGRLVLY